MPTLTANIPVGGCRVKISGPPQRVLRIVAKAVDRARADASGVRKKQLPGVVQYFQQFKR